MMHEATSCDHMRLGQATLFGSQGSQVKGAKMRSTSNHTISNKKLLGAPGIATRSKDATRGSCHTTSNKK